MISLPISWQVTRDRSDSFWPVAWSAVSTAFLPVMSLMIRAKPSGSPSGFMTGAPAMLTTLPSFPPGAASMSENLLGPVIAADGAVAVGLPLGGEGEDVRHEDRRDLFLVDLVNLVCAVKPGHGAPGGALCLADDQWKTVDDEDDIEPLLDRSCPVSPLVGDDEVVTAGVLNVDKPHGDVFAVLSEGHVFSPRSQIMQFSFARTRPSACTARRMARRL